MLIANISAHADAQNAASAAEAARTQVVAAAETPAPPPEKRIEVILETQRLIGWEGDQKVFEFAVTTGQEGQPTLSGEFEVLDKEENPYSYAWAFDMPYWLGIYQVGEFENGFHGLPVDSDGEELWGDALGVYPATHGCIVLARADARHLFEWADVGTKVDIHD